MSKQKQTKGTFYFSQSGKVECPLLPSYVGTQAKIVMDRKTAMGELMRGGGQAVGAEGLSPRVLSTDRDYSIPFLRRWVGDHAVFIIFYEQGTKDDEIRRLRDLFPEAKILPPMPLN